MDKGAGGRSLDEDEKTEEEEKSSKRERERETLAIGEDIMRKLRR